MSITKPEVQHTDPEACDDDGPVHVLCCIARVRLCGLPIAPDDQEVSEDLDTTCVVCDDLETNAYEFCPLGGTCIQAIGE